MYANENGLSCVCTVGRVLRYVYTNGTALSFVHALMAYNSAMCTHDRVCVDVCIMVVIRSVWECVQLYMHIW